MVQEIFKIIPNYPNYKVSNLGNVYSLLTNKILKPSESRGGYLQVILRKDNKSYAGKIHQLVAMAFLNHKPNGFNIVVDHIDNNPLNNNLNNLQLISNRENSSKDKKGYSSKYVGVSWNKLGKKWQAFIRINGKVTYLGKYKTELGACMAYRFKLKELRA